MFAALQDLARQRLWPMLLVSAAMWLLLAFGHAGWAPGYLCRSNDAGWGAFVARSQSFLLPRLAGSMLMLGAMMLPLLMPALETIVRRSLAHRRWRAPVLFLAGYLAVWLPLMQAMDMGASVLRSVGGSRPGITVALAIGVALAWQGTPWKRSFLNRSHATPPLPAFGIAAEWGSFRFGLSHALCCVGSCWALMLVPMVVEGGHLILMALVGLAIFWDQHARRIEASANRFALLAGVLLVASAIGAAWLI
ncbi:MAG TPA: DUF2182 domain-containing protein [Burkholderiaceae bacterium]|nr:DUF2182 domain-containing protein [Burkholderiaceae bacterium]